MWERESGESILQGGVDRRVVLSISTKTTNGGDLQGEGTKEKKGTKINMKRYWRGENASQRLFRIDGLIAESSRRGEKLRTGKGMDRGA